MRTLIDLTDTQIAALAEMSGRTGASRTALVREAVTEFLRDRAPERLDAAFGLWAAGPDGLAHQTALRDEW